MDLILYNILVPQNNNNYIQLLTITFYKKSMQCTYVYINIYINIYSNETQRKPEEH